MSQEMFLRGGELRRWIVRPEGDPTWNADDWARAATLEARWISRGVCEEERRLLLPCAVMKAKWAGTTYGAEIEARLLSLSLAS